MSKTSIMGLVLGLLFLGALFFIIGFLAAVATLKPDERQRNPQTAWQASNTSPQQDQQEDQGGRKLGYIAGAVGANLVGQALHKPLGKIAGAASSVLPQPLKPFARYGIGSARAEARSVGREMNPFYPHQRTPHQYTAPQVQPPSYEMPPPPAGYQQPPAFQGGYQGYAPMQQQAQPYYPPPQPMATPQPQMMPPQYPSPPYPPYPQQMPPQQGYYR